nr:unnamed protein product [Callosobruchus analis]CAI5856980.1 unnamed protein product [Callosobruchus analis]CAI5859427.1 unnamed protein product [Callosobruchus analis]CAI5861646.1 unnamed protein product [Callosobruchus analis]
MPHKWTYVHIVWNIVEKSSEKKILNIKQHSLQNINYIN